MGFYFSKFHETLHPHIPSVKNGSNEFIYNQLFAWTFPNDGDEHSFSGPQISRWIRNKEEIPSRIRQQAMISMEDALDNYAGCFYDIFCLGKLTISGQALEMMHDAMDQFQKEFPIAVCPHVDEKKDKRIFPASIALVTALIYDDLAYDGVSNANRHIETGLYMALLDAMEECNDRHIRFSSAHLLGVLFQDGYPLLHAALNDVDSGLGDIWKEHIEAYINKKRDQPHRDQTTLGEQEILFFSKICAFRDHYFDATLPANATEESICRVLPLCRKSKTMTNLWSAIAEKGCSPEKWDRTVKECSAHIYQTSLPTM